MGGLKKPSSKTKNPPILSHEFIIQNHGDIISCVAMVFLVGIMFKPTLPYSQPFVMVQHNVTVNDSSGNSQVLYEVGKMDLCAVFFYFLIAVVLHAVWQEQILDRINKKLHLSKIKTSKFNESGQLVLFSLVSSAFGVHLLNKEGFLYNVNLLWDGYPQHYMSMIFKMYFIAQLAYWTHWFPELYFQKVRRDEMKGRITYMTIYTIFIGVAYALNFTRIALLLLTLHYVSDTIFHVSRLIYFTGREHAASYGFLLWDVIFVVVRLLSLSLSVVTFWSRLAENSETSIDFETRNYNIPIVRLNCLFALSGTSFIDDARPKIVPGTPIGRSRC